MSADIDWSAALAYTHPGARWVLHGEDFDGLEWHEDTEPPTRQEVLSAWKQSEGLRRAEEARRRRQAAYQQEADPVFFAWQRGEVDKQAWLDKVAEVRARHPDPLGTP